jgi:hypothetical protein
MNDTDYIPIASLNQYAFCPHRCWRMFCAGEFIDNQYTIEGTSLHDRVHTQGEGHREETWQIRAIWLKSERYKLIGKSDLIESESGQFYPIEYKRGRKGEWDNDELQVCAQALCLEEICLLCPLSPAPTCRDFCPTARRRDRNNSICYNIIANRHYAPTRLQQTLFWMQSFRPMFASSCD